MNGLLARKSHVIALSLAVIQAVGFSDDEALLCTIGVQEDGRLLVWDMSTGAIVALVQSGIAETCLAWGGMVRDIKRRDTREYQFATTGNKKVLTEAWRTFQPTETAYSSALCVLQA